jgi:hypothetical protein
LVRFFFIPSKIRHKECDQTGFLCCSRVSRIGSVWFFSELCAFGDDEEKRKTPKSFANKTEIPGGGGEKLHCTIPKAQTSEKLPTSWSLAGSGFLPFYK